ncbi:P-loop NTPase fold protein [Marinifilum fragile]|uniref:KAP family P-loop NTPase fold protein n=1 Tax=Marinifilum fragile TaxID=570161 RepID=UPI002AAC2EB9|nr:P-loop NTPase fold protein [Marinifilum fragile]
MNTTRIDKIANWFSKRENQLQILEFPFQKINLLILASTIFWFLYVINSNQNEGFAKSITNLMYKYWINPFLSKIGTGEIPLFLLSLLAILIILFSVAKTLRRYVYSHKRISIYLVLLLNYTLLRFVESPYSFSRFSQSGWANHIAYWDLLYLLLVPITYGIWTLNRVETHNNNNNTSKKGALKPSYLNDDPAEEDIFPERINIAEKFSESIKEIQVKSSYAIGITSPWGNGKTTFLRFLLKKLKVKDDNAIFIEFSPWFCKTEADIISLFFDSLSDGLKAYHSSINNKLKKYAKIILALRKNTLTENLGKVINLFDESKELHTLYKDLNNHIGKLNRKIYISIDDLDRLYAKEIIECFKVIRNTANFKNIVFIVAYDAEYVDKALKEALNENHKNYIDKIIQLEYALPEIESNALVDFIEAKLRQFNIPYEEIYKILEPEFVDKIEASNNGTQKVNKLNLENYFGNVRDCIRILNSFSAQYQNLEGEVLPSDLFLVSILKTLYPDEALKIYLNLDDCFNENGGLQLKDLDQFKNIGKRVKDQSVKTEPRYFIKELNNSTDFLNLIQSIFFSQKPGILSASCNDNYEIYYNGVVAANKIRFKDFKEWMKSAEDLMEQIELLNLKKNSLKQEKLNNLAIKLSKYSPANKEQAQVQIHTLLYLQDILKFDYLYQYIISILNNFKSECINILAKIIDNPLNVKSKLITSLLFHIKLEYIRKANNPNNTLIVALDNGLELFNSLTLKMLKKKTLENRIDESLFDIYTSCAYKTDSNSKFIFDPKANKILRDLVAQKELQIPFLKNLEITRPDFDDKNMRAFRPQIDQIFTDEIDNYSGFEKFFKGVVMDNPNNAELDQIWDYWEKYKASNYRYYMLES